MTTPWDKDGVETANCLASMHCLEIANCAPVSGAGRMHKRKRHQYFQVGEMSVGDRGAALDEVDGDDAHYPRDLP